MINNSIVSPEWLQKHLEAPNLVVLNATIPKANDSYGKSSELEVIPNSRFFDIKQKFSDTSAPFPSTFPSEAQFTTQSQLLGINHDSCIIIYDEKGIYSSARAWWLFKIFGHQNVAVLDGGLPEWKHFRYIMAQKAIFKPLFLRIE